MVAVRNIKSVMGDKRKNIELIYESFNEAIVLLEKRLKNMCTAFTDLTEIADDILYYAKHLINYREKFNKVKLISAKDLMVDKSKDAKLVKQYIKEYYSYSFMTLVESKELRYSLENLSYRISSFRDYLIKIIDFIGEFNLVNWDDKGNRNLPFLFELYKNSSKIKGNRKLLKLINCIDQNSPISQVCQDRNYFLHNNHFRFYLSRGRGKLKITTRSFRKIDEVVLITKYLDAINDITKVLTILHNY